MFDDQINSLGSRRVIVLMCSSAESAFPCHVDPNRQYRTTGDKIYYSSSRRQWLGWGRRQSFIDSHHLLHLLYWTWFIVRTDATGSRIETLRPSFADARRNLLQKHSACKTAEAGDVNFERLFARLPIVLFLWHFPYSRMLASSRTALHVGVQECWINPLVTHPSAHSLYSLVSSSLIPSVASRICQICTQSSRDGECFRYVDEIYW